MKCLVLLSVVAAAVAYPVADDAPYALPSPPKVYAQVPKYPQAPLPQKYAPAPKYRPAGPKYKEPEYDPQPYTFEYGVADQYTGANFKATESQDDAGTVLGSYTVDLPDGRVQTVTYKADEYGGFVADVSYQGEPIYPPEPAEGYGNTYKAQYKAAPKKYAPAPKYQPKPKPAYEA